MKRWLLCLMLLPFRMAAAQSIPVHASFPATVLPPLPESSLQPVVSTTTVSNMPGMHYQYQLVHLGQSEVRLAPAWRGQTKLEPSRKLFNPDAAGELDDLLLKTMNELAADGWELLEIRAVTRPVEAVQKIERDLQFNDPQRPIYKGTTSIETSSQTRYLFRKALP